MLDVTPIFASTPQFRSPSVLAPGVKFRFACVSAYGMTLKLRGGATFSP